MTLEECRRFYAEEIRLAASVTSAALVEAFAAKASQHDALLRRADEGGGARATKSEACRSF